MFRRVERAIASPLRRLCLSTLRMLDGKQYHPVASSGDRVCPLCGYTGEFLAYGQYYVRPDARCRECGSNERTRLFKLWYDRNRASLRDRRVLHFAPEARLKPLLRSEAAEYVTSDLYRSNVDRHWDVEALDCPDDAFDVIVCNHVLEHVDAPAALGEFRRVLRPGGFALITVPICEGLEATYRNETAAGGSDMDRWKHFQQQDHVQILGRDFRETVRGCDLSLSEFRASGEEAVKHALVMGECIFIAGKPPAAEGAGSPVRPEGAS